MPHLHFIDSAPIQTAHRSFSSRTLLINHLTPSRPVARKMLIWCRSSRGKTGLLNSMMICHNRPLFLETHSAVRLSSARTPFVSHYIHGLLQSPLLQLLVPKGGREQLFLSYHASLFGGHLGRTRTLARLSHRFYWSGMSDDIKEWLGQCVACVKRKSPVGRHHPLGNIPTGHCWDRIAMDILDVCDPTPEGFRYILVIADYFSKWTEAVPMKNKCADTVADLLVDNIILRFGMPLVIHSDHSREFENGLMKSLCTMLGCTKTRTAPSHPESDGMIERYNHTCLMMLSMFVNDRRDNWHKLLPFVMHAYRTSVHESTGYCPFQLMMAEECSLSQDVSTAELRASRENDVAPHPFATWVQDALSHMTMFVIPFRGLQPAEND